MWFPIPVRRLVVAGVNFLKRGPVQFGQATRHTHQPAAAPVVQADQAGPLTVARAAQIDITGEALAAHTSQRAAPMSLASATDQIRAALGDPATLAGLRTRASHVTEYPVENGRTYPVGDDDDWTDPDQFNGVEAGEASMTGGKGGLGLEAKGGGLVATVRAPRPSRADYALNGAVLGVYLRQTGTLLDNGTLTYGIEGSVPRQQLGQAAGNVDQLFTHDLAAVLGGNWQPLFDGLDVWVEGSSAPLGRSVFARLSLLTVNSTAPEEIHA